MNKTTEPDVPYVARNKHDELFKLLLENFFVEFLELFVPKAAQLLDRNHLKFSPQEVIPDILEKNKHVVDILVETRLRDEEGVVLVHVENQAQRDPKYNQKMFLYFCALYQKYRRKILPIVVYAHDSEIEERSSYSLGFSFHRAIRFEFLPVHLKRLDWRQFIQQPNPVAAALLSKMGYTSREKVAVKVEFARMLTRMQLDPARQTLLTSFFETYLVLDNDEEQDYEQQLRQDLAPEEVDKVIELTTSYHERGRAEGLQEGIQQGLEQGLQQGELAGLRSSLLTVLDDHDDFGHYGNQLRSVIEAQTNKDTLLQWLRFAHRATSVQAFLGQVSSKKE